MARPSIDPKGFTVAILKDAGRNFLPGEALDLLAALDVECAITSTAELHVSPLIDERLSFTGRALPLGIELRHGSNSAKKDAAAFARTAPRTSVNE
jgi:hypothetical protein